MKHLSRKQNVNIYRAKTIDDFLFIREVRNESRSYMTGDQGYITEEAQIEFFYSIPQNSILLVIVINSCIRCGYVYIRSRDEKMIESIAILESYRGKGLGQLALGIALDQPFIKHQDVFAEIFEWNRSSQVIHERLGFRQSGKLNDVLHYHLAPR